MCIMLHLKYLVMTWHLMCVTLLSDTQLVLSKIVVAYCCSSSILNPHVLQPVHVLLVNYTLYYYDTQ